MLSFSPLIRPGQIRVITEALPRLARREPWTTFVLPTGYGKSDVFRCVAYEAWARKEAACTLLVAPNCYLADQLLDDDVVRAWTRRYGITETIRKRIITRPGVNYAANGEIMLSVNIQLVRTGLFDEWVRWMHRQGRIVNVAIDETTSYAENQWADWIDRLQREGASILMGTAYARRTDGQSLHGWKKTLIERTPYRFTRTRDGSTPDKITVDLYEGVEEEYELHPDIEPVTFRQAWNENALCKISSVPFDVKLDTYRDGEDVPERRLLSTLSESDVRRQLDRIVRDPDVIATGVQKMVAALRDLRRANPGTSRAAAIVYSANDRSREKNAHARQIEKEIHRQASDLRVLIVTMATEDDFAEAAVDLLREFSQETSKYDVLIVKQMGAVGLDALRLKVGLDLSPQRQPGPYIQRANRTTRPWAGLYHSVYVAPADCLAQGLFEELIESQGGAYHREAELIDSYETDRKEQPEETTAVAGTDDHVVSDTGRNWIPYEKMELAVRLLEELPALIGLYSYPELGHAGERLFGPAVEEPESSEAQHAEIQDTGRELDRLRDQIRKRIIVYARLEFVRKYGRKYRGPVDSELWKPIIQALWNRAKASAGVPLHMHAEDIQNLELMRRLHHAAEHL